MYKVMIVEDEIPIRNIIARMIDWNQLGFELVHQADNGQDALAYLETKKVDLIITDISMPFMDGLELCKQIRRVFPSLTIVILTGHNEFNYAQKAVSLNVSNYLLKPITKDSFTQTLREIKKEIDEKHDAQKNVEFLRIQYEKSRELMKNKFLLNLILGYSQSQFTENIDTLNLDIESPCYQVGVMELEDSQLKDTEFWGKDRPLLEFAIFNLSEELLRSVEQDIIFFGPGNQICFIFKLHKPADDEVNNRIILCLEDLVVQIESLFKIQATIGLSDVYQKLEDLSIGYKDALVALEYKVLESSEKVILKSNVEKKSSFAFHKVEEQLTRLEYSIKVGDLDNVKKIISFVFSMINYEKIDINVFRTFLLKLTITIFKAYNDIRTMDDEDVALDYTIFSQVFEITDFLEIKNYYMNLCHMLSNKIQIIRDDEEQGHVKEACDYIMENYHDPLLSLESLCNVLYLSPGHFSRLFKKTTGETFVDYLTRVRMDRAKYLLANTDRKMYEISNEIGYEDPNYFSYNFKKNVQVTPSEWRKKGGGNGEKS